MKQSSHIFRTQTCAICSAEADFFFSHTIHKNFYREFYFCNTCDFIFVPKEFHITEEDEFLRYEKHKWEEVSESSLILSNYSQHLLLIINSIIFPSITSIIFPCNRGYFSHLDFGCGKFSNFSTLLGKELREQGVNVRSLNYDLYYHNDEGIIREKNYGKFDIISCIEVIEHLTSPLQTIMLLNKLLSDNSILVISTNLLPHNISKDKTSKEFFTEWWYKNDITHINFFSEKTFHIIKEKLGFSAISIDFNKNVVLLVKSN